MLDREAIPRDSADVVHLGNDLDRLRQHDVGGVSSDDAAYPP